VTAPLRREPAVSDAFARYARQRRLPELGDEGQRRLAAARVLIVGVGGLGSPAALYLAAAGVGTLSLVDDDVVDESNLHRQLLYGTADIGRPKLDAAAARLANVNPLVRVVRHETRLGRDNAVDLIRGHDIVLDGTDTFAARYAINDACVMLGVPFVYGSVARFDGQVSVFGTPAGPCYRCLFPEPPAPGAVPTCAEEGVLGVLPGLIGLWQATEVLKWCAGLGQPLAGRLLLHDALAARTREVRVARRADCPACSPAGRAALAVAAGTPGVGASTPPVGVITPGVGGSPPPVAASTPAVAVITPAALQALLASDRPPLLLDVREPWEYRAAAIAGARLVPFGEVGALLETLDRTASCVVYCHRGRRSRVVVEWLREQGVPHAASLEGGIDAWSEQVDASVPRY
jgi:molybdopterin/thiamine biosynthesis adenylyltransferase/rhodanese-related sulfurtransferase